MRMHTSGVVLGAFMAAAVAVVVAIGASGAGAESRACKPSGTIVNGAIRFCGPATAKLSIFAGVTFRNGTCVRKTANGLPNLSLKLGARSLQNPLQKGGTNGGLAYFDLSVVGSLSHPVGGGVIAFYKGKHWYGRGVSFRGSAQSGTFVAQGIPERGSHGRATGSFHC
jgi:hypothetical protein